MFDNSKPNVILISDITDVITMSKSLGPYKVAHELRQAGIEAMVIHHAHTWTLDELKYLLKHLISDQTLFIGFNTMFYQSIEGITKTPNNPMYFKPAEMGVFLPHGKPANQEIKQFVHKLNPNVKFVIGGPRATDSVWNKDFDYIIFGYADLSIVRLARHLLDSTNELGISYRSIHGPRIIDDAKALGFEFSNSTMSYTDHDAILPGETLVIEISRGCIFKCTYCSYPLNGKKKLDYVRKEEQLFQEFLENYNRWGVTRYIFSDDTFNDSEEKINMIWRISKRLPFQLEYWAYIRLDLLGAHLEITDRLLESGLRGAYCGVETLNSKTAKLMGKGSNKEKLISTLKYIKSKWGDQVMVSAGFMLGLPEESLESMYNTIHMLQTKEFPVDTWHFYPTAIRDDYNEHANTYHSEIDQNYTKYGYRRLGKDDYHLDWENDYTSWQEVKKIATDAQQYSFDHGLAKIDAMTTFIIASLGFDLDYSRNKISADIPWDKLYHRKLDRAQQYKDRIYEVQGMTSYQKNAFPWTPQSE